MEKSIRECGRFASKPRRNRVFTIILFKPLKGITSQTVANNTNIRWDFKLNLLLIIFLYKIISIRKYVNVVAQK